jgi:hypothetical protein
METSYEERKAELARDRQIQKELIQKDIDEGMKYFWKWMGIIFGGIVLIIIMLSSF